MSRPSDLVVCGDVVVAATADGLVRAEALAIAGGRVTAVGTRREVLDAAPSARVIYAGASAVIPGLHDFHVHLVGLARSRAGVVLDDAADADEIASRLGEHQARVAPGAWLTGRGWSEAQLRGGTAVLATAAGERPAFLSSHDGHSAWASAAAMRAAGVGEATADPPGGRIERDAAGRPTGILRETALDLLEPHVPRLEGPRLEPYLRAVLDDLAAYGIAGVTEAGDATAESGTGPDADLGDSASTLLGLAHVIDGRLRMTVGIPVDAIEAAEVRGLRTGAPLPGLRTMRFGWAKEYADGALGSGTAALFEASTCGRRDTGILRVDPDELDRLFVASRRAGIALAIHAIGDRAAAAVLDAVERAGPRAAGVPSERIEHLQLVRPADRERLAALGVTASVQPIHAAADRDLVEACWDGRQADAYAWRSLADAGALLASGSDAPVESIDPWLGLFAAVHRRRPSDDRADWRPDQALRIEEALAAATLGPARALGLPDEGHLGIGARADLAVLDVDVATLLAADERLVDVRSDVTVVEGRIVHEG